MNNTAPTARSLKFKLSDGGQNPGERDRCYRVYARGQYLGEIQADWIPGVRTDESIPGFFFNHVDGRVGAGATRAAAVADAYSQEA